MSKQSRRGKDSPEVIRKRLQNSLPWSLSRWLADLCRKKK